MYNNRKKYSQNLIKSTNLASKIVDLCSFNTSIILEIGPGKGALTNHLINKYHDNNVQIIEIDKKFCEILEKKYIQSKNLRIINKDFLRYFLPTEPFSVISNIPFAFTSRILEKLLNPNSFMEKGIFIVQKEAADMFMGKNKESLKSLKYFPFWNFEILANLHKEDFRPSPNVNTVLLKITRKEKSLIRKEIYNEYLVFLKKIVKDRVGEGIWKQVFTKNQLRQIKNHTKLIFGKGIAVQDRYEILEIFRRFYK